MYIVRRKYAAGGDVWLADCETEIAARHEALVQSRRFEHGAVYVANRAGGKTDVICCFCAGLPTCWPWWNTPNVLTFHQGTYASSTNVTRLPQRG